MIRKYLLLIILTMATIAAEAQPPTLKVNQILDGKIVPLERMVVTKVRGRALSPYKLTFYRSARFEATATEMDKCLSAVKADAEKSNGNLMSKQDKGRKRLSLTLMLPSAGKTNRFVSYLQEKQCDHYRITLIYMEGTIGSIEELQKLIR